jgi:hypothetical protein
MTIMVQTTNYFMDNAFKSPHPIMNCKHTTTKEIDKVIMSLISKILLDMMTKIRF